jgi:hypothetical protein
VQTHGLVSSAQAHRIGVYDQLFSSKKNQNKIVLRI